MTKKTLIFIAASLFASTVYASNAPLHFDKPQDGVAYYQKDFATAIQIHDYARALADTYLLQEFTSQLYMASPE